MTGVIVSYTGFLGYTAGVGTGIVVSNGQAASMIKVLIINAFNNVVVQVKKMKSEGGGNNSNKNEI